jgi:hypothetical protein
MLCELLCLFGGISHSDAAFTFCLDVRVHPLGCPDVKVAWQGLVEIVIFFLWMTEGHWRIIGMFWERWNRTEHVFGEISVQVEMMWCHIKTTRFLLLVFHPSSGIEKQTHGAHT